MSSGLYQFLKYVKKTETDIEENELICKIKDIIQKIKRDRSWEEKFMLLEEMLKDEREAGIAEGIKIGRQQFFEELFEEIKNTKADPQEAEAEIQLLKKLLENSND